jgi:hypothetical protein
MQDPTTEGLGSGGECEAWMCAGACCTESCVEILDPV